MEVPACAGMTVLLIKFAMKLEVQTFE